MYTQKQFGFDYEGELITGDYTGKFIKQQPKIGKITNTFKKPAKVEKYSDKEFLELAVCKDDSRPALSVTHKKVSFDGFRMHILENIPDNTCKCKYCKNSMTPDYHVIIPRQFKGEIIVDRDALLQALNSCEIFTREGSNVVKLGFTADGLSVSGKSEETGESNHFINGDKYSHSGIEIIIGFNIEFIIDFAKSIDTEMITIKYNANNAPVMFFSGNRQAVIMPMFLGKG